MAWVSPSTRTTGTLITAAIWNQDVVANAIALNAGAISIASQAALDFIFGSSSAQLGRVAAGTAYQVPRINAAAAGYEFASLYGELLYAGSGTDANAGATNVATYALASKLSAADILVSFVALSSVTQQTSHPLLYNSTDSVNVVDFLNGGGNIAAGARISSMQVMQCEQPGVTALGAFSIGRDSNTGFVGGGDTWNNPTFTTNWTGAWTLALRHSGVTAGGTFKWRWRLFRLFGQ